MGPDNMLEAILGWTHAYPTVHVVMPNRWWAHTQHLAGALLGERGWALQQPSPTYLGSGAHLEPNMLAFKQCASNQFLTSNGLEPNTHQGFF